MSKIAGTYPELEEQVKDYAQKAVNEYDIDVSLDGMTFQVTKQLKRTAGNFSPGQIKIAHTVAADDWELAKSTIRHELVHAEQYQNDEDVAHNHQFRARAHAVDTEVHCPVFEEPEYVVVCPECEREWRRYRECKLVRQAERYTCAYCEHTGLEVNGRD